MDSDTRAMLARTVESWCTGRAELLEELETYPAHGQFPPQLFGELTELGILHVAHDVGGDDTLAMVAEIAHQFARVSPSVALLVVQQNLASELLVAAERPEPSGWIALPLYDSAAEWEWALGRRGIWSSIPALPIAERALIPLVTRAPGAAETNFALVELELAQRTRGVTRTSAGWVLGLRACPMGDLRLDPAPTESVILAGADAAALVERIWSRAEIHVMAIRSGIFDSSYARAHAYAKDRWQGGKMIIEHSLVRQTLARLYREKCALHESWRALSGSVGPRDGLSDGQLGLAMASAETLPRHTSDGIQLLGGNGYMEDYGQTRCFRDAKQCELLLGHPQAKSFATWHHAEAS